MAKNKKKHKNLASKVQRKMKPVESKPNPFEVKINKQKHSILGKKNKSNRGMPLVSRSKGIQKRNATLLQEYKHRNKANKFLDKRLGENDPDMSVEEKMMQRFALEKQRSHEKSSIYSLNTDDELTHYGQSLSSLEKMEEPQLESDEEEGGRLDKKFVAEEHFGGFLTKKKATDEGKPKTRQEIFEEIIAKSKKEKYDRQNEKDNVVKMTEQLDQDFRTVSQLLAKVKHNKEEEQPQKSDDYDMSVRELIFDMRAKATDRMKTPEELAKDEKERLEKLEADRQRRMKGITEEDEEDEKRRTQHRSADDLNDGFELSKDERSTLSYSDGVPLYSFHDGGENEEENGKSEDEDDEKDEEEQDDEDGDDEEEEEEEDNDSASDLESVPSESDDDNVDDDSDAGDVKATEPRRTSLKKNAESGPKKKVQIQESAEVKQKRAEMIKSAEKELPYTYKAPENLEEFQDVIGGQSLANQLIIIGRIRTCHHPSLAEGNRTKLETLTAILYKHLGDYVVQTDRLDVDFINGLTKHLYELTQLCALVSGNTLQAILMERFEQFSEEVASKGRGSYPSIDVLMYFKLVPVFFPTSDFRHSVVTPTMLFMGAILSQCPVRSLQDVAAGLFICNLFLKYVSLSKRFVPEAINFLRGVLFMASRHESRSGGLVVAPFKHTGRYAKLLQCEDISHVRPKPHNIMDVLLNADDIDKGEFSAWAVGLSCHILLEFSKLYVDLPSYKEVFQPIHVLLEAKEKLINNYHEEIKVLGEDLLKHIEEQSPRGKTVLQVEKKKPVPLKMFEPKIEENYDPTRKQRSTGNKDQDEHQRLIHRHKREMKGAMREIRKDSQFLARQKLKEQMERDNERKEKVKRLHQMLATQEGEFKEISRKKRKL